MTARVSLVMLAEKDLPTLGHCLASVADLVDEIVVITQPGASERWKSDAASFGARRCTKLPANVLIVLGERKEAQAALRRPLALHSANAWAAQTLSKLFKSPSVTRPARPARSTGAR